MVTDSLSKYQTFPLSQRLDSRASLIHSWLCVGLDPVVERLPRGIPRTAAGAVEFCSRIVDATAGSAVCFKINFGFFEALGSEGWKSLDAIRRWIPSDIPVIADAKRGDIGSTAEAYARGVFEELGFDAVTVSPYLGWDSLGPFLSYSNRAIFVLARTSNPGAADLQDLEVSGEPLYMRVARGVLLMSGAAEAGLVVGATCPAALTAIRGLDEDTLLLVPGVGAQGAGLRGTMRRAANHRGGRALINVSRDILYASPEPDFADAAARLAAELAGGTWIPGAE